jgi:hypothetical protein
MQATESEALTVLEKRAVTEAVLRQFRPLLRWCPYCHAVTKHESAETYLDATTDVCQVCHRCQYCRAKFEDCGCSLLLLEKVQGWPYGPPHFHQSCCVLFEGKDYCDCAASSSHEDDLDYGEARERNSPERRYLP